MEWILLSLSSRSTGGSHSLLCKVFRNFHINRGQISTISHQLYQKAKEYHQTANEIATEIGEKHGEGTGYLDLATVYSKECGYETAVEWYEKALGIFEVEANNDLLKEKALTDLGIAQFNLGNIKKATELFQSVRELANEGSSKGNYFHIKIKRKLYLF